MRDGYHWFTAEPDFFDYYFLGYIPYMIHQDVEQAIKQYGPSAQLDEFLRRWRLNVQARNWLNHWRLPPQDHAFVQFHNTYLKLRK
jgi:hypothetical protein